MTQESRNKQMNRLKNRAKLNPQTRANTDYKMAKKLQSKLNSLDELKLILDKIPKEKLAESKYKYITDDHVFTLLKLAEKIMDILEFKKIRGTEGCLYVIREKNKREEPTYAFSPESPKYTIKGTPHKVKPDVTDIKRGIKLAEHAYALEAFYDPEVPLPGYEKPIHYPIMDDWYDAVISANEEAEIFSKIEKWLDSGMSNIRQIAKEVGCQQIQVKNFIEGRRRAKELIEAKATLAQDMESIEKIKELWAEGCINRTEIAKAIGYPKNAVSAVIDRMMAKGEIARDLIVVPSGGFPNN